MAAAPLISEYPNCPFCLSAKGWATAQQANEIVVIRLSSSSLNTLSASFSLAAARGFKASIKTLRTLVGG